MLKNKDSPRSSYFSLVSHHLFTSYKPYDFYVGVMLLLVRLFVLPRLYEISGFATVQHSFRGNNDFYLRSQNGYSNFEI
jgi:hypothetical protein